MSIKITICNMLETRGYPIDRESLLLAQECYTAESPELGKISVFFPQSTAKVGVALIRNYRKELNAAGVTRAIVIGKDEITSEAKKEIVASAKQTPDADEGLFIEYFRENELILDKLKHELVPKHELLSTKEKEDLLLSYKIKESQLPKIMKSDAIARYFGARQGQVFKITRPSESCGSTVYYRIVV